MIVRMYKQNGSALFLFKSELILVCVLFLTFFSLLWEGVALEISDITSAKIIQADKVRITLKDHSLGLAKEEIQFSQPVAVYLIKARRNYYDIATAEIDLSKPLFLKYKRKQYEVQPDSVLDRFYSDKKLGCFWNDKETIFRLFAPRASQVALFLFDSFEAVTGRKHPMKKERNGVWEVVLPGHYFGKFYGYKVDGPQTATEDFDGSLLLYDPYSKAVATRNEYLHRGKTLILNDTDYDWQGDSWLGYKPEDLIIYECHVRDLTAHPSSAVSRELAGSYKGFLQRGCRGGIEYIASLGVNAVEFLPIHEFGNIEIPFKVPVDGMENTWNPYARNHWGYMTSCFFAPESYYASGNSLEPGKACGLDGRQVAELKDVVKALHRQGIAVILDVVYNHVSQYDQNCFKHIDKKYYFHLNPDQTYRAASGCGNDFLTARPMARRLILDSIKYWMTEYHIDGFRFDLAAMIDWKTVDLIFREARKINPDVILIAEPWGGGKYQPTEFSDHGWASWNDQFRNGIKGQNPENGLGFIFGRYWNNNIDAIKRYITGDLKKNGGQFNRSSHTVNYLESHDDHTFGDFIRIGLGDVKSDRVITRLDEHARLNERQKRLNKLGALILFTSQGGVMIAEGQEYGRSKVIAKTDAPDEQVGRIDHNSYDKDNETNWLNFEHAAINSDLVDYYKGLIELRKKHTVFRSIEPAEIHFLDGNNAFAFGFSMTATEAGKTRTYLVLLNAHKESVAQFKPDGTGWVVLADENKAGAEPLYEVQQSPVNLNPSSGLVLMRE